MRVRAVDDETYCITTQRHQPARSGRHLVCYRCGMLLGAYKRTSLGSLLDY